MVEGMSIIVKRTELKEPRRQALVEKLLEYVEEVAAFTAENVRIDIVPESNSAHTPGNATRITMDPGKMGGVPCIRGPRIPVSTVVGLVANGMTPEQIVNEYPDLEREDVSAALTFAAREVDKRHLYLASGQ